MIVGAATPRRFSVFDLVLVSLFFINDYYLRKGQNKSHKADERKLGICNWKRNTS